MVPPPCLHLQAWPVLFGLCMSPSVPCGVMGSSLDLVTGSQSHWALELGWWGWGGFIGPQEVVSPCRALGGCVWVTPWPGQGHSEEVAASAQVGVGQGQVPMTGVPTPRKKQTKAGVEWEEGRWPLLAGDGG